MVPGDRVISLAAYGGCVVLVEAYDQRIETILSAAMRENPEWFAPNADFTPHCRLTFLPPLSDSKVPDADLRQLAEIWLTARSALRASGRPGIQAWRALDRFGALIDARTFLYQVRGSNDRFYCLVPTDTLLRQVFARMWLLRAAHALAVHWITARGGAPLHASAVARDGDGFLFLGPSTAGKSTIAALSAQVGCRVIHDDQVLVAADGGGWRLTSSAGDPGPRLRAVFLLRKSRTVSVTPVAGAAAGAGITRALLEHAIGQDQPGPWLEGAFRNVARIAREIPTFELGFRRSPDFWDAIDAQLGF